MIDTISNLTTTPPNLETQGKREDEDWKRPLEEWLHHSPPLEKEGRLEAAKRIRHAYSSSNETTLDLSSLGISNLGHIPLPPHLNRLSLSNNQISDLRSLLQQLPEGLVLLDLSANRITNVADLRFPRSLTRLSLANNQIADLKILVQQLPRRLKTLDMEENQIIAVDGIQFPLYLECLVLTKNRISDVSALEIPSSLFYLHLGENQIVDVSRLQLNGNLWSLSLQNNPIRNVAELDLPPDLQYLDLRGCPLLTLRGCQFKRGLVRDIPEETLQQLGAEIVSEDGSLHSIPSLDLKLRFFAENDFYSKKYHPLREHSSSQQLSSFLHRMQVSWPGYKDSVKNYLNLSLQDPHFFDILFEEVHTANQNCQDRPLYCFNRLSVIATYYQSKKETNQLGMREALLAMHSMELIEMEAYRIFPNEALEIALYLQLQLKDTLSLPIAVTSMAHEEYAKKLFEEKSTLSAVAQLCIDAQKTIEQRQEILCCSPYFQKDFQERTQKLEEEYSDAIIFVMDPSEEVSEKSQSLVRTAVGTTAIEELTEKQRQEAIEALKKQCQQKKQEQLKSEAEALLKTENAVPEHWLSV